MSFTTPYLHETRDATEAEWRTTFECAEALRLIDRALELEDDPYWIAELHERRQAAMEFMVS